MGVLKILVLFTVIFVVLDDVSSQPQAKHTTVIETRFKRETEIDLNSRENNDKVPLSRKPSRPTIPVTKRLNPINVYPQRALPRRNMVPVVIKSKILNTTKNSVKPTEVKELNNENKLINETSVGKIKPSEPTQSVNLTDMENKNADDKNKNEEIKEQCTDDSPELTPIEKGMQITNNNDLEQTKEKNCENVSQINNKNDTQIENEEVDKKINKIITKEVKPSAVNIVANLPPAISLSNFKIVPAIPIQKTRKPVEHKENISTTIDNETYVKSKTKITKGLLDFVKNETENKEVSDKVAPKMVPLTILTDADKMPIKMATTTNLFQVPLLTKPMKLTNEFNISIDKNPVKRVESRNKTQINALRSDIQVAPSKSDLEEIVIQNNHYEELCEAGTPLYSTPKLIASELRFAPNWNNLYTQPSHYKKFIAPETKDSKYDIKKYGNEYVVNACYDTDNVETYYNVDDSQNVNNNNNAIVKYTNNVNPWNQAYNNYYNQPQAEIFDSRSSPRNVQAEEPKRIWRSWKNNQILIRPKYGAVNAELYKGLGRYLANANIQSNPVSNPFNRIGYSAYEIQNTSPCLNTFQ